MYGTDECGKPKFNHVLLISFYHIDRVKVELARLFFGELKVSDQC